MAFLIRATNNLVRGKGGVAGVGEGNWEEVVTV